MRTTKIPTNNKIKDDGWIDKITFPQLMLSENVQLALHKNGFTHVSYVQRRAICCRSLGKVEP